LSGLNNRKIAGKAEHDEIIDKGQRSDMARVIRIILVLSILGFGFVAFHFFNSTVESEILVSDHMKDFIDTVDRNKVKNENRLMIFDLDDTVFMSSQILGTPTWFYHMINLLQLSGAARHEAYEVVIAINRVVQEQVAVVPVEQATLSAIRNWQKESYVVGITSRSRDLAQITKAQLDQVGLSFSSSRFSCVESLWQDPDGDLIDGVLYADGNAKKDSALFNFVRQIQSCGIEVKLLAQADDQHHYVIKGAEFAKRHRIAFVGIIYGGALSSRMFDFAEAKSELLSLEAYLGTAIVPREYRQIFLNQAQMASSSGG